MPKPLTLHQTNTEEDESPKTAHLCLNCQEREGFCLLLNKLCFSVCVRVLAFSSKRCFAVEKAYLYNESAGCCCINIDFFFQKSISSACQWIFRTHIVLAFVIGTKPLAFPRFQILILITILHVLCMLCEE